MRLATGAVVGIAVIRAIVLVILGLALIGLAVIVAINGGPLAWLAIPFFGVLTWLLIAHDGDRRRLLALGCLVAGLVIVVLAVPGTPT